MALYISNRTSELGNSSSYEKWIGKRPDLTDLKVFGNGCIAHLSTNGGQQMLKRVYFIGYESKSKHYRLYDPETRSILTTCNVTFGRNVSYVMMTLRLSDKVDKIIGADPDELEEENVVRVDANNTAIENENVDNANNISTEYQGDADTGERKEVHVNEQDVSTEVDAIDQRTDVFKSFLSETDDEDDSKTDQNPVIVIESDHQSDTSDSQQR